jgi:MerR family mercuric resistance operon transcriptional regulator
MGALLFYERAGLMPQPERSPNGYRAYAESDLDRLALILRAKELGLSLREIAEFLEGIESGLPADRLREGILRKAEALQRKIDELEEAKRALLSIAASPKVGSCELIGKVARAAGPRGASRDESP